MRFAFSDEQLAFRDALRDLLAKECTPARVRDAWAATDGRTGLWPQLAAMGVVGLLAPDDANGLGGDEVDLVLLFEEAGRAALAEPLLETAAVAIPALRDAGDARVASFAAGDLTASVVAPGDTFAPWAGSAQLLVLLDDDGIDLCDVTDVALTPRRSVDGARRLFAVDASPSARHRVGDAGAAALAADRGRLAAAAQLLGLADRMLDLTVDYVRDRRQFGVPVGSFQAVKHHLANARLRLEFARPLAYRAAWSLATHDPDLHLHVGIAKIAANECSAVTARAALQCHGAIGYTTEYDLHLFMKRAWALARTWGDTASQRREAARAIL